MPIVTNKKPQAIMPHPKRNIFPVLALCLACVLTLSSCQRVENQFNRASVDVDLLLKDGSIRSSSGWTDALAISDGQIVALGDAAKALVSSATRVIELDGRSVYPGLHDMHVHPYTAGLAKMGCQIPPGSDFAKLSGALTTCIEKAEPGQWISGGAWSESAFISTQLTAKSLDTVSPNNPVYLVNETLHSAWLNSAALEQVQFEMIRDDAIDSEVVRDQKGDPTGIFRGAAADVAAFSIPLASKEERMESLRTALQEMVSYGITAITIAAVRPAEMDVWSTLYEQYGDELPYARGCIVWAPSWSMVDVGHEPAIATRAEFEKDRLNFDCVKIFVDGVPTNNRTAAMLDPYVSEDTGARLSGELKLPQKQLDTAVAQFDAQNLTIKFHAAGDRAVRSAITAIENARIVNGENGPRHQIGHASFVHSDDFVRAEMANVVWEFSPYIWLPAPIALSEISSVVGAERMERWIPIKDALSTRNRVIVGSDWPVVPNVSPFLGIETLTTREMPGGSESSVGKGQRIRIDEVLDIYTVNAADLLGRDDQTGVVSVGATADLVVTNRNIFDIPLSSIHAVNVEMTVIDGHVVFESQELEFGSRKTNLVK